MARKHGRDGLSFRDLLRANPSLVPGHAWKDRYVIDRATEKRILAHRDFAAVRRA
jgi:hypothetical protein